MHTRTVAKGEQPPKPNIYFAKNRRIRSSDKPTRDVLAVVLFFLSNASVGFSHGKRPQNRNDRRERVPLSPWKNGFLRRKAAFIAPPMIYGRFEECSEHFSYHFPALPVHSECPSGRTEELISQKDQPTLGWITFSHGVPKAFFGCVAGGGGEGEMGNPRGT